MPNWFANIDSDKGGELPLLVGVWYAKITGDETPEARLNRRLEKISEAWKDFQSTRARDAVYGHLAHVFAIVEHIRPENF